MLACMHTRRAHHTDQGLHLQAAAAVCSRHAHARLPAIWCAGLLAMHAARQAALAVPPCTACSTRGARRRGNPAYQVQGFDVGDRLRLLRLRLRSCLAAARLRVVHVVLSSKPCLLLHLHHTRPLTMLAGRQWCAAGGPGRWMPTWGSCLLCSCAHAARIAVPARSGALSTAYAHIRPSSSIPRTPSHLSATARPGARVQHNGLHGRNGYVRKCGRALALPGCRTVTQNLAKLRRTAPRTAI